MSLAPFVFRFSLCEGGKSCRPIACRTGWTVGNVCKTAGFPPFYGPRMPVPRMWNGSGISAGGKKRKWAENQGVSPLIPSDILDVHHAGDGFQGAAGLGGHVEGARQGDLHFLAALFGIQNEAQLAAAAGRQAALDAFKR